MIYTCARIMMPLFMAIGIGYAVEVANVGDDIVEYDGKSYLYEFPKSIKPDSKNNPFEKSFKPTISISRALEIGNEAKVKELFKIDPYKVIFRDIAYMAFGKDKWYYKISYTVRPTKDGGSSRVVLIVLMDGSLLTPSIK